VTRGAAVSATTLTRVPAVVMVLTRPDASDAPEAVVLETEHTTFTGASAAWFTVPVLQQQDLVIPIEVQLLFERGQRPGPTETGDQRRHYQLEQLMPNPSRAVKR